MKKKHKKKEKTECDNNYIEDYSNCSVDEDFGADKIYKAKRKLSNNIDSEATRSGLAAGNNFRISDELESENDA